MGERGNTHLHVERTRHWRECPTCEGQGEITVNPSHSGDPQLEDEADCPNPDCFRGEVEEWVDPLVVMRGWRNVYLGPRFPGYHRARSRAMKPVLLPPDFAVSAEAAAHFNAIVRRAA